MAFGVVLELDWKVYPAVTEQERIYPSWCNKHDQILWLLTQSKVDVKNIFYVAN